MAKARRYLPFFYVDCCITCHRQECACVHITLRDLPVLDTNTASTRLFSVEYLISFRFVYQDDSFAYGYNSHTLES